LLANDAERANHFLQQTLPTPGISVTSPPISIRLIFTNSSSNQQVSQSNRTDLIFSQIYFFSTLLYLAITMRS
jgi:hypothetical protein